MPPPLKPAVAFADVLRRQRAAILKQMWLQPANVLIGVDKLERLSGRPDALRQALTDGRSRIIPIDDVKIEDGVAYLPEVGSEPECWCRPVEKAVEKGPYERVWRAFQKQFYNSDYNDAKGPQWQIDHLYPETAAARQSYAYVRLLPLDSVANGNIGRALEGFMARRAWDARKEARDLTYLTMAKITGWRGQITKPVEWKVVYDLVKYVIKAGLAHQPGLSSDTYLFAQEVEGTYRTIRRYQGAPWDDGIIDKKLLEARMKAIGKTLTSA